jgi:hypothetical protein
MGNFDDNLKDIIDLEVIDGCRAPFDVPHGSDGNQLLVFTWARSRRLLCHEHAKMLMLELEAVFEGGLVK